MELLGITSKIGSRVEAHRRPLQSSEATDLSRKSISSQAISCLGVVTQINMEDIPHH